MVRRRHHDLQGNAENTGGSFAVIECITTPGGGPPPHIHTNEDEFWTVLDGTFEITIGGATHAAGPGDFAFGPRGIAHSFRNTADTPSRILLGFTPGGIEGFLPSPANLPPTTAKPQPSTTQRSHA